jgi:hypothetical protein
MNTRSKRHLLLPLLALAVTFVAVAPAHAQYHQVQGTGGTSASLQISFGSAPHWTTVRGTRVREIRTSDRPDYDMYNYGGTYYVYQNDSWYSSRRPQGRFVAMDERNVPREFSRVPRNHWRNYPQGWMDRNGNNNGYGNGRGRGNNQGRGSNGNNGGNH